MKIAKKLLLELALHRYDEEVQRNELIDSKNKSIVAFLGVMLTIQCTILPRLIEFKDKFQYNFFNFFNFLRKFFAGIHVYIE